MIDIDSGKIYYKELSKIKVVSQEEQMILVKKAKKGDEKSLDALVRGNLRFVVSIAKEYNCKGMTLGDLINEGNIGLIKAVKKFDINRGIHFISYAVWWVRQSILQFIYDNEEIVRTPVNKINLRSKINKAREILYRDLQREPTIEEIHRLTEISTKNIKDYFKNNNVDNDVKFVYNDNGIAFVQDYFDDDEYNNIERSLNRKDANFAINNILAHLSKREAVIIRLYFGLDGNPSLNLKEISQKLKITNERVRQIKDFALKKMRSRTNSKRLREFLNYEI